MATARALWRARQRVRPVCRIQRFDASGAFQGTWFPESESGQPAALLLAMTIDGEDNLYVAAKDRTTVYVLREP